MQSRLFLLMVRPSTISLITTVIAALLMLLASNWSYFTYNDALYPVLYGEFGAITALERSPSFVQGVVEGMSTSPIIYSVFIITSAVMVGWAVFLFVRFIRVSREVTSNSYQQHTALQRSGVRLLVGILWIGYGLATIYTIIPFCVLLSRIGAESILTVTGALLNAGAFALLALALHIHIVFVRLFLLRPRVFGGTADIEETAFPIHTIQK